jgi:hypothetical protein
MHHAVVACRSDQQRKEKHYKKTGEEVMNGILFLFFGDLGFVFLVISWGWGKDTHTHTHTHTHIPNNTTQT